MRPYQNKEFKALRDEWYQKLKKDGFEDVEQVVGNKDPNLKAWHSFHFQMSEHATRYSIIQPYYYHAEHFINEHEFEDEMQKRIWEMHTNGDPVRKIAVQLRTPTNQLNKDNINEIIRAIQEKFRERYMPNE